MSKDFFRRSELFANLADADIEWLLSQVEEVSLGEGEILIEEGAIGEAAYIVLEGEFEVSKKSDPQNFLLAVREPGQVIGEMALLENTPRMATVRAVRASRLLKISNDTFQKLLSQTPSAALAILHTVSNRLRQNEGLLRQSEKMAALGTLTAGLAHELNNPVAAIHRSVEHLRLKLTEWTNASSAIDRCLLSSEQIQVIHEIRTVIESRSTEAPKLDPLARSDLEASLQEWLEGNGVVEAWELSPTLVSCGWELDPLKKIASGFNSDTIPLVLKWVATGCAVYSLLDEIHLASERVSGIVKSVKAYSYLDQAPVQDVDIHEGLENTIVILKHKLKDGIELRREYDPQLPHIEAFGSGLNQVWTNLIDNSIDAMEGKGILTLRTHAQNGDVVVEIEDSGCGIPADIQERIFEPFYTTKPPGKGTGLGLHIAYTIINNHHGKITIHSHPGKTTFRIDLPVKLPEKQ